MEGEGQRCHGEVTFAVGGSGGDGEDMADGIWQMGFIIRYYLTKMINWINIHG